MTLSGNEPMINDTWSKDIVDAIKKTGLFDGIRVEPVASYPDIPLGIHCWMDDIPSSGKQLVCKYPIRPEMLKIWTAKQFLNHMLAGFSKDLQGFIETMALESEKPILRDVRDKLEPFIDWGVYNDWLNRS